MNLASHKPLIILALSLTLLVGTDYLNAWTAPTGNPPTGNVAAPINTGSAAQNKAGALGVNALAVFGASQFTGSATFTGVTTVNDKLNSEEFCNAAGDRCIKAEDMLKPVRLVPTRWYVSSTDMRNDWNQLFTDASNNRLVTKGARFDDAFMDTCTWDSTEDKPTASESDPNEALDNCASVLCSWHPDTRMEGEVLYHSKAYADGILSYRDGVQETDGWWEVACVWSSFYSL